MPPTTEHPICAALGSIAEALRDADACSPVFLSTVEKAVVLLQLPGLLARLTELNLRVMACADDVAEAHGARNIGDFIAHETRQSPGATARELRLAKELDDRRPLLRAALNEGRVNLAQAVEIVRALHALPGDLDIEIVARAEAALVEHAATFNPAELRRLGKRIIDVAAPELAEALEGERLADEERSARERQRLILKPQGDGTTRISGLLTDLCANRLATALNAITNPRRDRLAPPPCGCVPADDGRYADSCGDLECPGRDPHHDSDLRRDELGAVSPAGAAPLRRLSTPQRNARALNTLLESLDPKRLPLHGGDATTVVVTIGLDALRTGLGTAAIGSQRDAWHDRISAGEARRLACTAQILPAVLDGRSLLLDLGRAKRLYSWAQRRALAIQHPYCQAEGCRIPSSWCEAHHAIPWSEGGATDLANALLLCSKHHHFAHDPAYRLERHPCGVVRFTRHT
ncbi:DUF222 domain-containing protein [Nocardioides sp. Bht2]